MDDLVVRPSSLADWSDCSRRFAARDLANMLAAAGYEIRKRGPAIHIGAAVGTAVHAYAYATVAPRMAGNPLAQPDQAEEQAIAAFRAETDGSVDWDEVTSTANDAERQIRRMSRAWRATMAEDIVPVLMEERLEADTGNGIVLSGQPDLAQDMGPHIRVRDMKSNKIRRSPHLQVGAYASLLEAHDFRVGEVAMDHIPRAKLSKPQPDPTLVVLDLASAKADAWRALQDIERCVTEFEKRAADPCGGSSITAFAPNPASMLCSARWCPAWGTNTCRAHLNT